MGKCCPNDGNGVYYTGTEEALTGDGYQEVDVWYCDDCHTTWQAEELIECGDIGDAEQYQDADGSNAIASADVVDVDNKTDNGSISLEDWKQYVEESERLDQEIVNAINDHNGF